jgi:glycosyltransferase involved in cell wall biosynthesis
MNHQAPNHLTISIVTPSYNQGQFLDETIRSGISQEGDFLLDYIIVDGGSTDNSVYIIKHYEGLLQRGERPILHGCWKARYVGRNCRLRRDAR